MSIATYRRRPIEVTAMRLLTKADFDDAWMWINNNGGKAAQNFSLFGDAEDMNLTIRTDTASVRASIGDWIVKQDNEFYPLRPEVFTAIYEEAA